MGSGDRNDGETNWKQQRVFPQNVCLFPHAWLCARCCQKRNCERCLPSLPTRSSLLCSPFSPPPPPRCRLQHPATVITASNSCFRPTSTLHPVRQRHYPDFYSWMLNGKPHHHSHHQPI
ncbi:hypothetical protein V5799_013934 [Amblyomma americanum]|uniref:Uncharacterized protein n=1 Tax=Amblyomma americanum TaxID=6943 RepID=A0AAQ4E4H3_AMBAM